MSIRKAARQDVAIAREKKIADCLREVEIGLSDLSSSFCDFTDAQDNVASAANELRHIANLDILKVSDNSASTDEAGGIECDVDEMNGAAEDFAQNLADVLVNLKQYKKLDPKGFPKYRKTMFRHYDFLFKRYIDKMMK
jgi:hypothetical protein